MATDFQILPNAGYQRINLIELSLTPVTGGKTICTLNVASARYLSVDIDNIGGGDFTEFVLMAKGTANGQWQTLASSSTDYTSPKAFRRVWTSGANNDLTSLPSGESMSFALDVIDFYAIKLVVNVSDDTNIIASAEVH